MVICYNYKKDGYFILLYLELKNISNIKEIKEDIFKKLRNFFFLREDSSLGYPINFKRINLSQLIGGKYFIVPYTVSQNRYGVDTTALINTEINGFIFINTTCVINITKFLNIKAT